jgi:GH24 family phage-related lysozyme (muramidase)
MYLDDAVAVLVDFEGRIHWMYLDTDGNVTVGVGEMLPTSADALHLPFLCQNAQLATPAEIVAQFDAVKRMEPGLKPLAYRRFESLLLADADIDAALRATLSRCAGELSALFPDFHEFPDAAKVALLDMRFNLGLTRLRKEYPHFCSSVGQHRWDVAALQCHRIQPDKQRNQWTQEQFIHAGSLDAQAKESV